MSLKPATKRRISSDPAFDHFCEIADARFVMRKALRIVDESARAHDLDALEHHALIQIYGSRTDVLVRSVAERLDISSTFASKIVRRLVKDGYAAKRENPADMRATLLEITPAGQKLLAEIESQVRVQMKAFTSRLNRDQKVASIEAMARLVEARLGRIDVTGAKTRR
jgi:DNA-binding MarR family transcriptional regulator